MRKRVSRSLIREEIDLALTRHFQTREVYDGSTSQNRQDNQLVLDPFLFKIGMGKPVIVEDLARSARRIFDSSQVDA